MSQRSSVAAGSKAFVDFIESRSMPEPNTGCWIWLGALSTQKYGRIFRNGANRLVSRLVWEAHNSRVIPVGLCALHRCDNTYCVNPDHIFIGSMSDNSIDMARKGRHPMSRLNFQDINRIRELIGEGRTHKYIADLYSVTPSTIANIRNGRTRSRELSN